VLHTGRTSSVVWDSFQTRLDQRATIECVTPQYTPMAPTRVREPFHRDGWVYEKEVDGWRILAYKDSGRARIF
jgi:hypothetical protein